MQTVFLSEHAVEKSVLQSAVIIIQLYQQICRIRAVDPLRGILNSIILCLAGNCIAQYNTPDRLSAEKSDIKFLYGAYPIRYPFLIYFKTEIIKNIRWIFESEMTINIPVKMITCRILHAFIQFDKLRVLRRHIDLNIRGDPFALICEPFDKACIF